jgi:hypothetical protein
MKPAQAAVPNMPLPAFPCHVWVPCTPRLPYLESDVSGQSSQVGTKVLYLTVLVLQGLDHPLTPPKVLI